MLAARILIFLTSPVAKVTAKRLTTSEIVKKKKLF